MLLFAGEPFEFRLVPAFVRTVENRLQRLAAVAEPLRERPAAGVVNGVQGAEMLQQFEAFTPAHPRQLQIGEPAER